MATRKVKLTGIGEWMKIFAENRDLKGYKKTPEAQGTYEKTNGACTLNLIIDDNEYAKLKASKSMLNGKTDVEGRGMNVKFKRDFESPAGDWESGPPVVVKDDDTPWDYEVDGTIGNGSTVEVLLSVYDVPNYGSVGTRLEKVKILNHIEYIPDDTASIPQTSDKITEDAVMF